MVRKSYGIDIYSIGSNLTDDRAAVSRPLERTPATDLDISASAFTTPGIPHPLNDLN